MMISMLRVMALSLVRDRAALVMAFVLPPAIFVIFAAIFSSTANDELPMRVSLGSVDSGEVWNRLEAMLRDEPSLNVLAATENTHAAVIRQVESGAADVGLFLKDDPNSPRSAPLVVIAEPSKPLAGAILAGQVQRLIALRMPDLALSRSLVAIEPVIGGLTPEQTARLQQTIADLATGTDDQALRGTAMLVETSLTSPDGSADAAVSYYSGAVAILFLLFSAMQSAAVLIDERRSGILDRIAVAPAGPQAVIFGKFLFLVSQGVVQAALIFAAAAFFYDVNVINRIGLWLLVTLAAAMAVSGLALAVAATCTSRQQAQTISTFIVLVCSAIGGSMVPRFMMPSWLQDVGRLTPNAWVIEAYQDALWRKQALTALLPELGSMLALAAGGVLFAVAVSRRRLRLS